MHLTTNTQIRLNVIGSLVGYRGTHFHEEDSLFQLIILRSMPLLLFLGQWLVSSAVNECPAFRFRHQTIFVGVYKIPSCSLQLLAGRCPKVVKGCDSWHRTCCWTNMAHDESFSSVLRLVESFEHPLGKRKYQQG